MRKIFQIIWFRFWSHQTSDNFTA